MYTCAISIVRISMVMAPMVWRADFRHPNRGHAIHFQPADDPPVDPLFTRNNRAQKGAPPWTERRVVFFLFADSVHGCVLCSSPNNDTDATSGIHPLTSRRSLITIPDASRRPPPTPSCFLVVWGKTAGVDRGGREWRPKRWLVCRSVYGHVAAELRTSSLVWWPC